MFAALGTGGFRDGASAGDLLVFALLVYVGYRIQRWRAHRREQAMSDFDVPDELYSTHLEDR